MTEIFLKVLNLSIGAVPIMAALLVLRFLFKKAVPRKVFYIAWALVFLRLMVPFSLESNLSFFNFVPKAEVIEENIGTSVVFVENENERVEFPVFVNPDRENPNVDGVYHSAITGEIVTGPDITTVPMDKNMIFGTIWIFGTAGLLLFGIIGYFAVLRKTNFESVPYTKNIRLSDFFKTPIVCGLFRPKIILPMNFDLDDEAKVASVIAHECTHIRRKDNLWRLLATFTLYVHWFNPFVWICYNAFIRDMEVSCDEEVLGKSKNDIRAEYAESLVALAGNGTNPLYGGVLSFGECAVKERVKCIMNFKKTTLMIIILCVAAIAALGVIFLTNPSAIHNPKEFSFEISGGDDISFSRENGLEINLSFTNTDDKPLWLSSDITVDRFKDGKGYTEKFESPYGTVMVEPGKTVVFCDKVPAEYCLNEPVYGEWVIARSVSSDEEFRDESGASFSFEIKENHSFKTAEDIVAFVKENPDMLELIENPSKAKLNDLEYYKKTNQGIPEVIVEFFYLYHSAFVTLEVPDFSELDKGTGNFYKMEQYLKYQIARERIENENDYVTDFELEIQKESGDARAYVYSCKFNYKHKGGRESGGVDTWKFVLLENPKTGKEEIELFEWKQEGYGGLYPGLINVFEDIRMRYYPYHNDDYELIANIGICEIMIENGFFKENDIIYATLDSARIGNFVTLGNYNGALEWLVIGEKDDQLLLITKDCIEALPYHDKRKKVTWPDSDIREWLNNDFIEYTFSEEEKMFISGAVLENPDNKRPGGAIGSNKTIDEVFLLSHDEVLEYFPNGFNIYTEPTPSAEKNLTTYEIEGRESWWWWTRSPGLGQDMATAVNGVTFGIADDGLVVTEKCGVRPAMWVFKTYEAAKENLENAEVNPAIGYDIYAAVYSGKVPEGETVQGKYIPKSSVLPSNVVWANEEQKEYCEDLLDSIDLGFASAFLVGSYDDTNTRVGIGMTQAEKLYKIIKKAELVTSEPTNPNMPVSKEIHIVMESGDYVKIVWDTSYFTIYRKGDENAFRFDASKMKDSFTEFCNLADEYFIHGAGTLAQYPESPDMEHLIPEDEETITTLFNNSSKFAAESKIGDELRNILKYKNFKSVINPEDAEVSSLGNPLTKVDGVEFARTDDGKKYTLSLYEKGFVLSGSASGKLNGAVVTVEEKTWEKFVDKINAEFENSQKFVPYWFGLINQKNVLGITAKHEDFSRFYNSGNAFETDYLQEIIYRLRNIGVSSEGERFNGNQIPETNEKYLVLTIEFNTWTEYTVIFTRTEVIMVSSDMSYGLRYKTEIDGYDCFLDFATEEGPINAITG
ncbi:MAG: M56 family metallopeptidase [Oscillospiraceae bacterium]|nr:M56 family metallopeptidase [Oscillospiraceae bacterium]